MHTDGSLEKDSGKPNPSTEKEYMHFGYGDGGVCGGLCIVFLTNVLSALASLWQRLRLHISRTHMGHSEQGALHYP